MQQNTLSSAFVIEGVGIHTGVHARLTVHPSEPDTGRVFITDGVSIPARADFVVDTTRSTTLGRDGARVSTVEHLLSALSGCGLDNCRIEIDGPEVPILDGSALPFVDAIRSAGVAGQNVAARVLRLSEPITVSVGSTELRAIPSDQSSIEVTTDFDDWPDGSASVRLQITDGIPVGYSESIAPARTFAFRREVEMLIAAGLAKGGSLDNALIITPPGEYSSPLRVPFEWCAHKALDIIGDLALLDSRVAMRIVARRPGHRMNTELARAILAQRPL